MKIDLGDFENVIRAKKPSKLPVVFSCDETRLILLQLKGVHWLMGQLLYGAGLRVMECVRMRVKDVDFGCRQIVVRDGKGVQSPGDMLFGDKRGRASQ
jgi:site-specific recombinase XerD